MKLNDFNIIKSVETHPWDSEVTIIVDDTGITQQEWKELEIGLNEGIEAIRKHLPSRRSISRIVMEWSF